MEGVTEGNYIPLMTKRHWVKCWWTPFLRISTGVPRRTILARWLRPYLDSGLPVIAQLMGTHTGRLAEAAARLASLGAVCIDLNCACPSKNVIGSQAGGYRLKFPDWIAETLVTMRKAMPMTTAISVKMRMGLESPREFEGIAEAVRTAAPDMITLHFRTVAEQYRTIGDGLERLAWARALLPDCFIVGCGDIFSVDDAQRMVETTGVDAVAPARGLMANPALLMQIEAACRGLPVPTVTDVQKTDFLQEMLDASPTARGRGYVMQSAVPMLGKDHPWIAEHLKPRAAIHHDNARNQ